MPVLFFLTPPFLPQSCHSFKRLPPAHPDPLPANRMLFQFSNSYSKIFAVHREGEERVDRWKGLEGLTMAVPHPQESCNSMSSATAQLLELSWRWWKEERTCSVDDLAKLALSSAFSSQISFHAPSCQQVALALGISVWAELYQTM